MTSSRRDFLARSVQLGVLLGAGVPLLQACGGSDSSSTGKKTDPIADGLSPEAGPLRVFNYDSYVSPDVVKAFEDKYGVKVEITTFTTDTEALTKLASGAVKIDVHHSMAGTSIDRLIDGGLLQPLNKSYLTNFGNILSTLQDPWYDKGSAYSAAYMYFGTGIAYRTDRIDPAQVDEQGWDAIWKATDFKGQVSVLDDEREALVMAMMRKGEFDVNTTDQATIDQAQADLTELIDLVNVKVNIEAYKNIPEGSTTIAHTWSPDMVNAYAAYLPEGTDPSVLGFWHPPAGEYLVTNDSMGVVAGCEHPVLAHLYINFLLDNAIAEQNFTWVGYLPALTKLDADYVIGAGYVPENLRACIPTKEEIEKALYLKPLGIDGDAQYTAAWSKFTSGA
jgi:spermidine/putrescine transport system substrate-binding protein